MLLVGSFFLLTLARRHKDTLLEEVGGRDNRVGIQFAIVFDLLDPHEVILTVHI